MKSLKPTICRRKPTALLRTAALLLSVPVFYFALYCLVAGAVIIQTRKCMPGDDYSVDVSREGALFPRQAVIYKQRIITLRANLKKTMPNEIMMKKEITYLFIPAIEVHAYLKYHSKIEIECLLPDFIAF